MRSGSQPSTLNPGRWADSAFEIWRGVQATKLAQRGKPEGTAVWAPDGASVVFTARDKNGVQRMYRADASNTRPESVLLDEHGLHWPNDWVLHENNHVGCGVLPVV